MKNWLHKAGQWLNRNKIPILQMTLISVSIALPHAFASDVTTNMPWDKGVNAIQSALTGPLAKAGSAISIASSGLLWMFGETQVTKTAMRASLGTGIALGAPTAATTLSGVTVSGCLF